MMRLAAASPGLLGGLWGLVSAECHSINEVRAGSNQSEGASSGDASIPLFGRCPAHRHDMTLGSRCRTVFRPPRRVGDASPRDRLADTRARQRQRRRGRAPSLPPHAGNCCAHHSRKVERKPCTVAPSRLNAAQPQEHRSAADRPLGLAAGEQVIAVTDRGHRIDYLHRGSARRHAVLAASFHFVHRELSTCGRRDRSRPSGRQSPRRSAQHSGLPIRAHGRRSRPGRATRP